jgi:hypothetical protein
MADAERPRAARAAGPLLLAVLCLGGAPSGAAQAAPAWAFANASPIHVYDRPASKGGRNENFEFGKAYEVDQQVSGYVRLRTGSGATAYVRSADVTLATSPQWLVTTPYFNETERQRIRFWNSAEKLKGSFAHSTTPGSQWEYEEYFDNAPAFQLRLPVTQSDKVNSLGREKPIFSVMMPISREMYRAFESERAGFDRKMDVYLIADVSGSTRDFLESAAGGLARTLSNTSLRDRVNAVFVTTFGIGRHEKSSFRGKVAPKDLASFPWHRPGVGQTRDQRDPLVDGLAAMNRGIRADSSSGAPVLIVLSAADVEFSGSEAASRSVTIDNLQLKLPASAVAIFAQITPEPGTDLRYVSERLRGMSHVHYLDYSETLADDLSANLRRLAETPKFTAANAMNAIARTAHSKKMMAFLPRVLTSSASLPGLASDADWYAIRLWLAVDELIWKVE